PFDATPGSAHLRSHRSGELVNNGAFAECFLEQSRSQQRRARRVLALARWDISQLEISHHARPLWEGSMTRQLTVIWLVVGVTAGACLLAGAAGGFAKQPSDIQQASDMTLVGTNDLQHRSTYQPTLHKYPNNQYILFTGHHPLGLQGEGLLPNAQPLPSFNPL